jgi:hypothetical protein
VNKKHILPKNRSVIQAARKWKALQNPAYGFARGRAPLDHYRDVIEGKFK